MKRLERASRKDEGGGKNNQEQETVTELKNKKRKKDKIKHRQQKSGVLETSETSLKVKRLNVENDYSSSVLVSSTKTKKNKKKWNEKPLKSDVQSPDIKQTGDVSSKKKKKVKKQENLDIKDTIKSGASPVKTDKDGSPGNSVGPIRKKKKSSSKRNKYKHLDELRRQQQSGTVPSEFMTGASSPKIFSDLTAKVLYDKNPAHGSQKALNNGHDSGHDKKKKVKRKKDKKNEKMLSTETTPVTIDREVNDKTKDNDREKISTDVIEEKKSDKKDKKKNKKRKLVESESVENDIYINSSNGQPIPKKLKRKDSIKQNAKKKKKKDVDSTSKSPMMNSPFNVDQLKAVLIPAQGDAQVTGKTGIFNRMFYFFGEPINLLWAPATKVRF